MFLRYSSMIGFTKFFKKYNMWIMKKTPKYLESNLASISKNYLPNLKIYFVHIFIFIWSQWIYSSIWVAKSNIKTKKQKMSFSITFFVYFFRTETVSPVQKITKIEKRKKIHIIVFQRTPALALAKCTYQSKIKLTVITLVSKWHMHRVL